MDSKMIYYNMDGIHKEALLGCRELLVEEIAFNELSDCLLATKLIPPTSMETIAAGEGRAEKVRRLLDDLPKRGRNAYNILIKCLRSPGQNHLADAILKEEDRLRRGEESENLSEGMHSLIDETIQRLETHEKNEGQFFVRSPAFKQCINQLAQRDHVVIFGEHGDGKTTMGLEVLCQTRHQKQRTAVIINNKKDWSKFDCYDQQLIILFDDMLGKFGLNESLKNFWFSELPYIWWLVRQGKIQVIITCRESIFSTVENDLESFDLFTPRNRIYLSGPDCVYPLDAETKFNIIQKHVELRRTNSTHDSETEQGDNITPGQQCNISAETLEQISKKSCVGFMLKCKVFVSEAAYQSSGAEFFDLDADFLFLEIDRWRNSEEVNTKIKYCTMACVLLKQGLNVDQIDEDEIVEEIATPYILSSEEARYAAEQLMSTYLIIKNDKYQFQHDLWLELVFKSFFKINMPLLIKYCKFGLIEDLITTECRSADLCELSESQYESLIERLVLEIGKRNVIRSFCQRFFTNATFTKKFCSYVDNMREVEKTAVLLSVERDRQWGRLCGAGDGDDSMLYWSAYSADLSLVVWAVDGLSKLRTESYLKREMSDALVSACAGGNLNVVTWLLKQSGIAVSDDCIVAAAIGGNVGIVKKLLNSNKKNFSEKGLSRAVMAAQIYHSKDIINLLYPSDYPILNRTSDIIPLLGWWRTSLAK